MGSTDIGRDICYWKPVWDDMRDCRKGTILRLSLDGYMAPEGMTLENWDKPEYKNWGARWGALMAWILNQ